MSEVVSHDGQRVVVLGRYRALKEAPPTGPTGVEGFKPGPRPYGRAVIEIAGGQLIVNPPMSKTSMRSPDELEDYSGQLVRVVGTVHTGRDAHLELEKLELDLRESKEYQPRSVFDELSGLESWKFVQQEEIPGARPWDLARDYAVRVNGGVYTLRLFRYPSAERTEPPPPEDGLQYAHATGPRPAYVGMVSLSYSGAPAHWANLVARLAELAFEATPAQLKWLGDLDPDRKGEWEKEGLFVQVKSGCVTLWGGEPLGSRRGYLELEPRGRRKP